LCGILTHGARGAEFEYKLATGQDPTHPVNIRAAEALNRIREATGGKLDIKLFPANQLGSDTDLLSQVRGGSVEFFNGAIDLGPGSTLTVAFFFPLSHRTSTCSLSTNTSVSGS
jgi:TRAP-type C4-dicarboxylate transport system substrate-binding protein